MHRHVHDGAALHPPLGSVGAFWIGESLVVAVFLGIGVDQRPDRPVVLRELGLDAAPAPAVAGERDLPFDRDPEFRELFVVLRDSVIHIDHFPGDVSVGGVGVVSQKPPLVGGVLVIGDPGLGQPQRVGLGPDDLDVPINRQRHERLGDFDLRVEAEGPELLERVLGYPLAAMTEPGDVRLFGHELHVLPEPGRIGNRPETFLQLPLFVPLPTEESPGRVARLS